MIGISEQQQPRPDEPGAARGAHPAHAALEATALLSTTMDEDAAAAAAASSSGRPWGVPAPHTAAYRLLGHVNESTKWVVAGVVFVVLLAAHNEWAAWSVVGAVTSSFLCKVLKHIINEQRPPSARKKDPGMPSSHSNSLNFLSVTAAMSLLHFGGRQPAAAPLAAATIAVGLFLTWLRVALGYHTWPQVLAGGLLGASTAAAWFAWGTGHAVPALRSWPPGVPLLYAATAVGMALFAARNVLVWHQERRERRADGKARGSDDAGGEWRGAQPQAAG